MRRILVIGARGMLGTDLVEALQLAFPNGDVIGWDIDEIDIQREGETVAKVEEIHPGIVINVAAYTDVDRCEQEEERAFAVNAEGMRNVALGASRSQAKVVYLSTDYVFDGEKGEPYLEEDPPCPINVYGRSKLKGEQYVQSLAKDFLIIRTQWLYGRHGKNFVATILRLAGEKSILSIVDDQIGSPTFTKDLSQAMAALIQKDARGIFHATNSDICSWYTFGQAILKLARIENVKVIPISSKELDRPAPRPAYSVLSTQKLRRETQLVLRPWPESLKEYLSTHPLPELLPQGQR